MAAAAATERKDKRRILFRRLRVLAYRYDTTVEHLLGALLVIAFPTLEKLTVEEFHGQFGQGMRIRVTRARRDRRRITQMEKHVKIARKREDRILARVSATHVKPAVKAES